MGHRTGHQVGHRISSYGHSLTVASALLVLIVLLAGCAGVSSVPLNVVPSTTPSQTPGNATPDTTNGPLRVQGAQIVDDKGHPVVLRGAMIPTSLAYIKRWQQGQDPTTTLSPATFAAMASWHMNTVRINISYYIYQLDPTTYMSKLDQAVHDAHAAGLYVVLDYHDDKQSGDPNADGLMHQDALTFWTLIASHYANDHMMLFDPINEPKYTGWQTWLNGDGASVVGYQQVITAIRAAGAKQIIVLEPGHGCSCGHGGWSGVDSYLPKDPNVIFSLHVYSTVITGTPSSWDADWGPILGHHPAYYGEWAVLPYSDTPAQCKGLTAANASTVTTAFLNYLQARQINWTAWAFTPTHLIQDLKTYTPTTFSAGGNWSCEATSAQQAGMGSDVKQFLATHH